MVKAVPPSFTFVSKSVLGVMVTTSLSVSGIIFPSGHFCTLTIVGEKNVTFTFFPPAEISTFFCSVAPTVTTVSSIKTVVNSFFIKVIFCVGKILDKEKNGLIVFLSNNQTVS